jgi:N-acetylmuramic acid 6-phosphate etherase
MNNERLEQSLEIDRASALEIVRIISAQDRTVAAAVAAEETSIAQAIDAIADRLRSGGRLFYAGAGTSGRIAMLDASEIPPTYGVDPEMVQVILAGGERAFFQAVEGAEDSEEDAVEQVSSRVRPEDSVVGIAASGSTPFTVTAIRRANMQGALTVGLTAVRESFLARECDIPIVAETGPEVIMGSSRMKSGTAQKMILNMISTGVMIRLGKVYSNLMVEMPATNRKLRARAVKMVEMATGCDRHAAENAIARADGEVTTAVVMLRRNLGAAAARELLSRSPGGLREALEG